MKIDSRFSLGRQTRCSRRASAVIWTCRSAKRCWDDSVTARFISRFWKMSAERMFSWCNLTVVAPDAGGVERARFFAKKLDAPLAIVDKRRVDVDVSEVMNLIGDVRGRSALVVDDIIDTAGTLVKTAEALLREGATQVYAACTHAVLSGPAVERLQKSKICEVVATDSVPLTEAAKKVGKIRILSVADLLARGIRSIHEETSISELFI